MRKIQENNYPFKVWIHTVIISLVLVMVVGTILNSASLQMLVNAIPAIFLLMLFGLLFSLPTLLIYFLPFLVVKKIPVSIQVMKTLMALWGLLVIGTSFYFFYKWFGIFKDGIETYIYFINFICSSFWVKIIPTESK